MSRKIDNDFGDRLRQAAEKSGIPYSQTAIGDYLKVRKQNVDAWMKGTLPRADQLFVVADKLGVDARWLATGIADGKKVYEPSNKAEQIVAVIKTLLHTDEQELEEIVAAAQALSGENGHTGEQQRSKSRRSRA